MKTSTGSKKDKQLVNQITNWRTKGFDVSDCLDGNEMIKAAGLDWDMKISQVVTPNGTPTPWSQLIRVDRDGEELPLSIAPGSNWEVLSNKEFCDRAIAVADSFGGIVDRAGWLMKSTNAVTQTSFSWAMVSPNSEMSECAIEGYEGIKPTILLTSGTSYACGYSSRLLFVRSVCQNGMIDAQTVATRSTHQTTGDAFAGFTLDQVKISIANYIKERDLLLETQISSESAFQWFVHHYSSENKAALPLESQPQKLRVLWDVYNGVIDDRFAEAGISLGQAKIKGTYYGLLQSVVAYNNHFNLSGDNSLIEIINGDRAKEMTSIRNTLLSAAKHRAKSGSVSVGVRAW